MSAKITPDRNASFCKTELMKKWKDL